MHDSSAMTFRPINDDHAVVSATFTIYLARAIAPTELEAMLMRRNEVESELPAISRGDVMPVDASGNPAGAELPALEFAYLRPNGIPIWKLKVGGYEIAVECTRYTRWERVWKQARAFFEWSLSGSELESIVTSSSLRVIDRFISNETAVDFSKVLVESELLPAFVFNKSRSWHCHTGWFEGGNDEVLHNLNIDSRRDAGNINLYINHFVREGNSSGSFDSAVLDNQMTKYHLSNKSVLDSILCAELKDKIDLYGARK